MLVLYYLIAVLLYYVTLRNLNVLIVFLKTILVVQQPLIVALTLIKYALEASVSKDVAPLVQAVL